MAELLVVARDFTDDKVLPKKGDILVVRPDGWEWGKCECPPDFVVVKLKGVKEEDVKHYEQSLVDTTNPEKPVVVKQQKYSIDIATVDDCAKEIGGKKEVNPTIKVASGNAIKENS